VSSLKTALKTEEKDKRGPNGRYIVQCPPEVSLCAGCNACEIVCALVHEGKTGPSLRRIFLERDTVLMNHHVYACRHCVNHLCYDACSKKEIAMFLDEEKGIVYINPKGCTGRKLCIKACPFEPKRINFDESCKKAIKCDLCRTREKGPACVEYCQVRCIDISDEPLPLPLLLNAPARMSGGESGE
jgi:Fe-S-cluster-containing dehydrogenase component